MLEHNRIGLILSNGEVAIVDAADYPKISHLRWCPKPGVHTWYVCANLPVGDHKFKTIFLHRVLTDAAKGTEVDHKNHNGLHNWRSNLRVVPKGTGNRHNRRKYTTLTSRFKGVSWNKQAKLWFVQIGINGVQRCIARCSDEIDAARIYDEAALEMYGEFACLNLPTEATHQAALSVDLSRKPSSQISIL